MKLTMLLGLLAFHLYAATPHREIDQKLLDRIKHGNMPHLLKSAIRKSGISKIRYKYIQDNELKVDFEISKNQPQNQGNSGRCWIFAGERLISEAARNKWGKNFSFSHNYIAFADKLERANYYLEKVYDLAIQRKSTYSMDFQQLNKILGDGGEWQLFKNIVKKYGLIPKEAMPDTYFSLKSSGYNNIIYKRLRTYASEIHCQVINLPEQFKRARFEELKVKALREVNQILETYLGKPTAEFRFTPMTGEHAKETRYYTPHEFMQASQIDMDAYIHLVNLPYLPLNRKIIVKNVGNVIGNQDLNGYNVNMKTIKEAMRRSIIAGNGAEIHCSMSHHDREKHLLSYKNDQISQIFKWKNIKTKKGQELLYGIEKIAHGMYVVGCDGNKEPKDEKQTSETEGRPANSLLGPLWKAQNSWKSEEYVFMTEDWVDHYGYGFIVRKEFLPEQVKNEIDSFRPHTVPAWDAFGKITSLMQEPEEF